MKPVRFRYAGFTLIEILIALGIISALAALAFPVFSKVKEKSRYATCTGNLEQLALATQQYVQDNDGVFPLGYNLASIRPPKEPRILWHHRLRPYVKTHSVYFCPTMSSLAPWSYSEFESSNYTYNYSSLNKRNFFAGENSPNHEATVQFPSTTFLNTESVGLPPNPNGGFGPPEPELGRVVPSPCGKRLALSAVVHSGGANYSFVDGHVKWLLPEAAAQAVCDSDPTLE